VASNTAVATTATTASNIACRGSARGERIKPKITGVWDGLDEAGRLLLETRSGVHAVAAGEVFGMQTTVVNPPAAAACAPVSIVSL